MTNNYYRTKQLIYILIKNEASRYVSSIGC